MKLINQKLRSRSGESLAETMVAVLVIALALTMLAGMISATANIVKKSESKMNEYYEANAVLESMKNSETPSSMTIKIQSEADSMKFSVNWYENDVFPKQPIIAYQLTGSGSNP